MPAEISAGDLFPVPRFVQEGDPSKAAERHRDLIAQALNEVAAAAFSVQILGDSSATQQDTTTSAVTYSGLGLTIISPVVAKAIIVVWLDVVAQTWTSGQGSLFATLRRNAVAAKAATWYPSAQDARQPVTLFDVVETLLPQTSYAYDIQVGTTGGGTNVYRVNPQASAIRCGMAAVVLPRSLA